MTLPQRMGWALVLLAGTVGGVPEAGAETYLTGYGGIVFGGDLASGRGDDLDLDNRHGTYGAAVGFIGSPLGLEVEFGYSPDFFGGNRMLVPENNLVTLMGNLVFSGQAGRTRIYASAGAGLLKSSVNDPDDFFDVGRNDFGANAAVGLLTPVGSNLAIRGDLRYFRNLGDEEPDRNLDIDFGSFDFWRATAGLSLRF